MAVEAGGVGVGVGGPPHHSLFHPQILIENNKFNNNNNHSNALLSPPPPPPYATTATATAAAMYYSSAGFFTDSINHFPANNTTAAAAAAIKAESGLTCSLPVSRKRARDSSSEINNTLISFVNSHHNNIIMNHNHNHNDEMERSGGYTFLGEDISFQIQQQQLEIDQFIAHHTEKVRLDVEERRKRNSRRILMAVEEGISNRLRAKEEEITKIAKLNWSLEERIKSLSVENQIWRELALTNEATANALRNNLKQVLEQDDRHRFRSSSINRACVDDADDAQSCCESNNNNDNDNDNDDEIEEDNTKQQSIAMGIIHNHNNNNNNDSSNNNKRLCRNCGKYESCVLLLPCRHLCLCTGCASSVNICPICKSTKNISVHVNMS